MTKMGSITATGRATRTRAIGPIGTIGRVALGLGLIGMAIFGSGVHWYEAGLGPVGFPAALLLWQSLRLRFTTATLSATGPVGFFVNFAIGFALFSMPFTRDATLLFYGSSLLLAAVRGYAGCEVLAISNWLLRRDDQVGCVVFSPLDAVESQVTGKKATT